MMRKLLLIAALLLITPATASAATNDFSYQNDRVAHDARLDYMIEFASDMLTKEGHAPQYGCVKPTMFVAESMWIEEENGKRYAASGLGWSPGPDECKIMLDSGDVGGLLAQGTARYRGERYGMRLKLRRAAYGSLYALIKHEVGHTRGLDHTNDGSYMDPSASADEIQELPVVTHTLAPRKRNRR